MIKYKYKKLNDEPIKIEYVPDEREEINDYKASFWWWNKRYFLEDFTRCHNNPCIDDTFPEYISGFETDAYYSPLFIELIDGCDEFLNVYEEIEENV